MTALPFIELARRIVDIAWQEATESTEVPSTDIADRIVREAENLTQSEVEYAPGQYVGLTAEPEELTTLEGRSAREQSEIMALARLFGILNDRCNRGAEREYWLRRQLVNLGLYRWQPDDPLTQGLAELTDLGRAALAILKE